MNAHGLSDMLQATLDAVSAPLLLHDGERIVFSNDAMQRLLGSSREALLQLPPDGWASPEHREGLRDYGRRCLASAEPLPALEVEAQTASGSLRYLEITARRISDASRVMALTTCQDLSDMRHVQNSLLEVGRVMHQIIENDPVPTFVLDAAHRVTHWNAACAELTGIASHEMLGRTDAWRAFYASPRPLLAELLIDDRVLSEGRLHYGPDLQAAPGGRETYECEEFFPRLGREGRWLYFTAAPLRDIEGRVIGAIETLQDVSARRQAEEGLRRHQTELESIVAQRTAELLHSHQELEAFMQNASVGIIATRGWQITRSNKKFAEVFELRADCSLDALDVRRFFPSAEDYRRLSRIARHALAAGTSLTHEMRLLTAQGQPIWVQLIAYASDSATQDAGMWWLLQDRSDVMRAQEELVNNYRNIKETNARLEEAQNQLLQSEKMASIGQLAAGVAHEINNPIGFVSSNLATLRRYATGLLQLLQADATRAPEAELARLREQVDLEFIVEDLPVLLDESEEGLSRVKKIVQDLKDFSRVDHADWQDADLNAGLESTLNVVMNEVKYRADVQRHYGPLPPVRCLAGQLNQVFMNLIVNAAHAMEGRPRGLITLSTGLQALDGTDWVCIEVADNGAGMPPEVQRRIFEPFFTTKPVGQGTGLGLSLAFSIVQKHGGRIELQSEPGVGTRFKVWVPVAGPAQA